MSFPGNVVEHDRDTAQHWDKPQRHGQFTELDQEESGTSYDNIKSITTGTIFLVSRKLRFPLVLKKKCYWCFIHCSRNTFSTLYSTHYQMLGHDIQSHERHALDINVMAEEMLSNEHYDSENISVKQVCVLETSNMGTLGH